MESISLASQPDRSTSESFKIYFHKPSSRRPALGSQ